VKTQTSEEVLVSTHLVALEWYQSKSLQDESQSIYFVFWKIQIDESGQCPFSPNFPRQHSFCQR